jgi:hypothetical protein
MEETDKPQPKDDLAQKIFKWPKDHPVLTLLAVGALSVVSYLASGPSGGVEACNDSGVIQTLQASLTSKMTSTAANLSNSQEARVMGASNMLEQIKSISATVSGINQTGVDKDNKIRSCEGSVTYKNYNESYAPMLRAFGTRTCNGPVRYRITRPLDTPNNYSINWTCD